MSHLDYLNKDEWKKLGIISLTSFLTIQIFLYLVYLFFPGEAEAGIYLKYIYASLIYAFCYSVISFLFLLFKGEKAYKPLILTNLATPVCLIVYAFLFLLLGPHG